MKVSSESSAIPSEEDVIVCVDSVGVRKESTVASPLILEDPDLKSCWSQETTEPEHARKRFPSSCSSGDEGDSESEDPRSGRRTCIRTPASSLAPQCYLTSATCSSAGSLSKANRDLPITPPATHAGFYETGSHRSTRPPQRQGLTIDTTLGVPPRRSHSESSSMVLTNVDDFSPSEYLDCTMSVGGKSSRMSGIEVVDAMSPDYEDLEMRSPSAWSAMDYHRGSFIPSEFHVSTTSLSSFGAACPSSILTLSSSSSHNSIYPSSRQYRDHGRSMSSASSRPTITNASSSSYFSYQGNREDTVVGTDDDIVLVSPSSPIEAKRKKYASHSVRHHAHRSFLRAQSSKFNLHSFSFSHAPRGPRSFARNHAEEEMQGQSPPSRALHSSVRAPAPTQALRRTPFRWFNEMRTNVFQA